jgi:vacuolar iron transporter family protein
MLAILLPPAALRVPVAYTAVLVALGLTGALSARLGGSNARRAVLRVVVGRALGLAFTYASATCSAPHRHVQRLLISQSTSM